MKLLRILAIPVIILGVTLLACCSPTMEQRLEGIEQYSPANSSLGLSANLFPDEHFPEMFEYTAGDYQFYFNGRLHNGFSTAISALQYAPEQYTQAKEYCLKQFTLTDEHQYQIGDYTFIEHLCYNSQTENGDYVPACQFPKLFNMFAYSDANCTLLFLGYYNNQTTTQTFTSFESLYCEYFSQYHLLED